jgi:hypothetical protein
MRYSWEWHVALISTMVIFGLPTFLEQQYALPWGVSFAATVVFALPIAWLYDRHREHQTGLPVSSFARFLRRFIGALEKPRAQRKETGLGYWYFQWSIATAISAVGGRMACVAEADPMVEKWFNARSRSARTRLSLLKF